MVNVEKYDALSEVEGKIKNYVPYVPDGVQKKTNHNRHNSSQ